MRQSGFIHFDIAQVSDTPPPIPAPQEVGGMVVPTLDEEIYDKHLLLMMSCVLELPAKNFPISSKRSRVVTLEFYGVLQDTPAILESSL